MCISKSKRKVDVAVCNKLSPYYSHCFGTPPHPSWHTLCLQELFLMKAQTTIWNSLRKLIYFCLMLAIMVLLNNWFLIYTYWHIKDKINYHTTLINYMSLNELLFICLFISDVLIIKILFNIVVKYTNVSFVTS